jgi:hypothetical protein
MLVHEINFYELQHPSLEDESSSLGDSLRMACSDCDPIRVMPLNTTLKLAAFGWLIQLVRAVAWHLEQSWF